MKTKDLLMRFGIFIITILFVTNCSLFKGSDDDSGGTTSATDANIEATMVDNEAGQNPFTAAMSILSSAIPSYMKGKYITEDTLELELGCISIDSILDIFTTGSTASVKVFTTPMTKSNPAVDFALDPEVNYICAIYETTDLEMVCPFFIKAEGEDESDSVGLQAGSYGLDIKVDPDTGNCTGDLTIVSGNLKVADVYDGLPDFTGKYKCDMNWDETMSDKTGEKSLLKRIKAEGEESRQGGFESFDLILVQDASGEAEHDIKLKPEFESIPVEGKIRLLGVAKDNKIPISFAFEDTWTEFNGCQMINTFKIEGGSDEDLTVIGAGFNASFNMYVTVKPPEGKAADYCDSQFQKQNEKATLECTRIEDVHIAYADFGADVEEFDIDKTGEMQITFSPWNFYQFCEQSTSTNANGYSLISDSDLAIELLTEIYGSGSQANVQANLLDNGENTSGVDGNYNLANDVFTLTLGKLAKTMDWVNGSGHYSLAQSSGNILECFVTSFYSYNEDAQNEEEAKRIEVELGCQLFNSDYSCSAGFWLTSDPGQQGGGSDQYLGMELDMQQIEKNVGSACTQTEINSVVGSGPDNLTGHVSSTNDGTASVSVNNGSTQILNATGLILQEDGSAWSEIKDTTNKTAHTYELQFRNEDGIFKSIFEYNYKNGTNSCYISYKLESVDYSQTGTGGQPGGGYQQPVQFPLTQDKSFGGALSSYDYVYSDGNGCSSSDFQTVFGQNTLPTLQEYPNFFLKGSITSSDLKVKIGLNPGDYNPPTVPRIGGESTFINQYGSWNAQVNVTGLTSAQAGFDIWLYSYIDYQTNAQKYDLSVGFKYKGNSGCMIELYKYINIP